MQNESFLYVGCIYEDDNGYVFGSTKGEVDSLHLDVSSPKLEQIILQGNTHRYHLGGGGI